MATRSQRRKTRTAALHKKKHWAVARRSILAAVLIAVTLWGSVALAAPARTDAAGSSAISSLRLYNPSFRTAYDSGEPFVGDAKTSVGLCNFAGKAMREEWNYVYGAKGQRMTSGLISSIISANMDDARSPYTSVDYIANTMAQTGNRATDCSGLVMNYMWWAGDNSDPIRALCPSIGGYNANAMLETAQERGTMDTLPEIPGILLHRNGHVGIYIGNGEIIEARGVKYGVVKTLLSNSTWGYWSKSPWIDYDLSGIYDINGRTVFLDHGEDIGQERWIRKYVYGDASAGGTYVPYFDPNATYVTAEAVIADVELGEGEVYGLDGTIVKLADLTIPEQVVVLLNTLPYEEDKGYFYLDHWYIVTKNEDGTWTVTLNDPVPSAEPTQSDLPEASPTETQPDSTQSADVTETPFIPSGVPSLSPSPDASETEAPGEAPSDSWSEEQDEEGTAEEQDETEYEFEDAEES